MALELRYENQPDLLKIEVSGDAELTDFISLIDAVALETRRGGTRARSCAMSFHCRRGRDVVA